MMEESTEILVTINRLCSNIQSEDRRKRKKALDDLYTIIFEKSSNYNSQKIDEIFANIEKNVLKSLYDSSETVKDSCITLLSEFISVLTPNEKFLSDLIPILLWRLGDKEINEPSEEIRLRLVILINSIILKYKTHCGAFVEDLVQILTKTLVDSYPKIRQESCSCASNLASVVPRHFYEHSNKLIKPILASFSHRHHRIRVSAIEALGNVVRWGSTKNLPVQEVFGSLAERLFDSTPNVRSAVTKVIGDWLINLPDRYSFFTKMIPLILTSLSDENDLRNEAWEIWCKAGLQYEHENEQDLKDKMDFLYEKPDHYPSHVLRPNLGCRTLVQRNMCQITPALFRELEDWKMDIRIRSAQLLWWLVLHAESDITQHTENILLAMYRICNQTDHRVIENVENAAELIGYFVLPDVYMELIMPVMQDVCTAGHLCVLSALIRGSKASTIKNHVHRIATFISDDNICQVRKADYQFYLLKCVESLLVLSKEDLCDVSSYLFIVLINVKALSQISHKVFAQKLLEKLSTCLEKETVTDLYKENIEAIFTKMESNAETWTSVSHDYSTFQLIIEESGVALGLYLSSVTKLLKKIMRADGDPIIRSKFFIIMSSVLCRRHEVLSLANNSAYCEFIVSFIQDIICPNLVWHAGRTAEALRTVVVASLCAILLNPSESTSLFGENFELGGLTRDSFFELLSKEVVEEIFKTLFPLLLNSIEDSAAKTRLYSLIALKNLILVAAKTEIITPDHVNQSYPLVLKRLDDVSNDVRISAVNYLILMYSNLPACYNPVAFEPHLNSLFSTLLIHLDDPDENFQKHMTDVLKTVGKVDPKILHEKLDAVKSRFRNFHLCNDILDYLKDMFSKNLENSNRD